MQRFRGGHEFGEGVEEVFGLHVDHTSSGQGSSKVAARALEQEPVVAFLDLERFRRADRADTPVTGDHQGDALRRELGGVLDGIFGNRGFA